MVSPEYKMELSMGWTRKRESPLGPLERYNRAFAEAIGHNTQLLTPSSEGVESGPRHAITYKFCEGPNPRLKKVDGLRCPLCRERPKSFPRLLLHCSTFHDHFRFDVDETEQDPAPDSSVVNKTILLSVSTQQEYEKTTEQGADEEIFQWVAPERPFELQAHLRGDYSWTGYTKAKAAKRRGRHAGAHSKDAQPATGPRAVIKRPAPEEVLDVPRIPHKKHRVPDVPGVRFYHSLSKKAIEPGEMVSDSDESVDEFWMMDIQRRALQELSINGAAQDFTMAFNRHLAREQSTSSLLMKEAVVRFTRLHRRELRDVGWQRSFRKKLEQLLGAGVINRLTVTHCIQLMQASNEGENVEMVNGIHEPGISSTAGPSKGQPNGVVNHAPNEVGKQRQDNVGSLRTPSTEPSARNTPTTNGERRSRGRSRWGVGGSISRDNTHASPSLYRETPDGTGSSAVNDRPNGIDPSERGTPKPVARDEGKANVPAPAPQARTPSKLADVCHCGISAKDNRTAVICSNLKCVRKDFHLACVGLERRQKGWRCVECSAAAAVVA